MSQINTDLLITLTADKSDENNVTIAFTMGMKALEKGHQTEILLLSNAVHIAEKGYADQIDIGEPFSPVKDAMQTYLEMGGTLKVCKSCMEHNGVKEENIIDGADIITADYVIDALMGAKKSLQLN